MTTAPKMRKILLAEDEAAIRRVLKNILTESIEQVEILEAGNGREALDAIQQNRDLSLVLCDIKMPSPDGLEVLSQTIPERPGLPFIMISGHGDIDTAVECIKKGAVDYICKPPDLKRLLSSVNDALQGSPRPKAESVRSEVTESPQKDGSFPMIGHSPALEQVRGMIRRVAPTDARVLVTGENGTGKELVVRQLHLNSRRSHSPLIEVNCAAIPSELIESELFGHEKGSFTSAVRQHKGKFEQAHGGTLFLDEIGDMSPAAQAKVLRVLQESKISRVGSDVSIPVDVRLIAATNKDLKKEIEKGLFREDLYHRLSVIEIRVPPLRDRREDIPELILYFSQKASRENSAPIKTFTPQAVEKLKNLPWSGNIRQLQNIVERLCILSPGEEIDREQVELYC